MKALLGTSSQRCGSRARSGMAAPAIATLCRSTFFPSTTQRSVPSDWRSMCGMRSPHFAFDMRRVQTSGCSCTWSSALMNPYLSSIGRGLLVEAVNAQRVAVAQLIALGLRHALETALDELPRLGIGGCRVRKIRFPHDVVHADHMAQLDAGALVPEIHTHLALEELARPRHDA